MSPESKAEMLKKKSLWETGGASGTPGEIYETAWVDCEAFHASQAPKEGGDAEWIKRAEYIERSYAHALKLDHWQNKEVYFIAKKLRETLQSAQAPADEVRKVRAAWKADVDEKCRLQQEVFDLKARLLEPQATSDEARELRTKLKEIEDWLNCIRRHSTWKPK